MAVTRSSYYGKAVRARIEEFLGGTDARDATCRYLISGDTETPHVTHRYRVADLGVLYEQGAEIARSLWDDASLIADLDVEYVNFDDPAEAYLHPERVFALQAPVQETITNLLRAYGIIPLHFLTGRGHHFVWQIRQKSRAFQRLAELGKGSASFWERYSRDGRSDLPSLQTARAFAGLGMVMEFLAAEAKWLAAPRSEIPVELTAVEVGPSDHGREMISIDISEYGDPLEGRFLRVPFSAYLKPWQLNGWIPEETLAKIAPIFAVPLGEMTVNEALNVMRDPETTARLAETASTKIPEASKAMERLIDDYEKSDVKKFHDKFYSQEPLPKKDWPETYDLAPLELMPACCRLVLEQPNDLLLRPSCLLRVVRVLLALGWHPRHIAGLINSRYQRDFHWTQFEGCDPALRADFYVRIFAGLFATRRDDMVDFNCTSAREEGICFFQNCNDNLLRFRASALARRDNDQLAGGPFNRLLSPTQHS